MSRFLLLFCLCLLSLGSWAQYTADDEISSDKDTTVDAPMRWSFGGNFAFQISGGLTLLEINPLAYANFKNDWFSYAGPVFTYLGVKELGIQSYQYGLSTGFGKRFRDKVRVELNPLVMKVDWYDNATESLVGKWIGMLYLGAAVNLQGVTLGLYYDLIEHPFSPYRNPSLRIGFGF